MNVFFYLMIVLLLFSCAKGEFEDLYMNERAKKSSCEVKPFDPNQYYDSSNFHIYQTNSDFEIFDGFFLLASSLKF